MSSATNGRKIQDIEQKLCSTVNSPSMSKTDYFANEKQDIEADKPRKSDIMPSIRQFLLTLMVVSLLTITIVSAATTNRSPGNVSPPCMEDQQAFRELLDTVEPALLHDVLHQHMGEKYQHGVYESDKDTMEAVYRQEPGVAHALVGAAKANAMIELAKRQVGSNSTASTTSSISSSTVITSVSVTTSHSSSSVSVAPSSTSVSTTAIVSTSAPVTTSAATSATTHETSPTTAPSSTIEQTSVTTSIQVDQTTTTQVIPVSTSAATTNSGMFKSELTSHSLSSTYTSALTLPNFFFVNSTFSAFFPTIIPHDSSISTVGSHPTTSASLESSFTVSSAISISASSTISLENFPVILNAIISSSTSLGYSSTIVSVFGPSSVGYHTPSSISPSGSGSGSGNDGTSLTSASASSFVGYDRLSVDSLLPISTSIGSQGSIATSTYSYGTSLTSASASRNHGTSLNLASASSFIGYDHLSVDSIFPISTSIGSQGSIAASTYSSFVNLPSNAFSSSLSGLDLYLDSGLTSASISQSRSSASSQVTTSASEASTSASRVSESSSSPTSVPLATGASTSEASISSRVSTSQATASGAITSGTSSLSTEASNASVLSSLTTSAGSPATDSYYTVVITSTSTDVAQSTASSADETSTQAAETTSKKTTISSTSTKVYTTTLPNGSLSTVTAVTVVPAVVTGGYSGSTSTSSGGASLQTNSAGKNNLGINLILGAVGMAVVGVL
ncbi:hypothetical protein NHQ30_002670 [Ciborinia camelliae]|nr:hypothetical protein NHQ30_002670 [Ciborinia camelliae]